MRRRRAEVKGEALLPMSAEEKEAARLRLEGEVLRRQGAAVESPSGASSGGEVLPHGVVNVGGAMPEVLSAIEGFRARVAVSSAEAMRERIWRECIQPTLEAWGWPDRTRQEIKDWQCAEQEGTFRVCAQRLRGQGAIVALIGQFGTGKTSLAAQLAIAEAWREREETLAPAGNRQPVRVAPFLYRTMTDLLATFKPLYIGAGSINAEQLAERRERLCTEPNTLVIDEMHALSEVAARDALLIDVVNRRYEHRRDTILISNELEGEFRQNTHPSILSRIQEHGVILRCEWQSWRERLAEVPTGRRSGR